MNSRLFNGNISRASNRKIPHLAGAEDLPHCEISIRRLSDAGSYPDHLLGRRMSASAGCRHDPWDKAAQFLLRYLPLPAAAP